MEIALSGSGGQGIQFAGQVLALAAIHQGLLATYVPSYGAERRGGPSFCSVVISPEPIYSPAFAHPDVLLSLDQRGFNQYAARVKPQGLILANSDLVTDTAAARAERVLIPATRLAEEICGAGAMNLVMLGAFLARTRAVNPEPVRTAVEERSRKKPELLAGNLAALARGEAWMKEAKP